MKWIPIPTIATGDFYDNKWRQRWVCLLRILDRSTENELKLLIRKLIIDFLKHVNEERFRRQVRPGVREPAVIGDVENAPVPIVDISSLRRFIRKNDRKEELKISETLIEKINETLSEF